MVIQSPPGSPYRALFCVELSAYPRAGDEVAEACQPRTDNPSRQGYRSGTTTADYYPYLLILYPKKSQTLVAEGPWLQMSQVIIMHQFVRVGFFVPLGGMLDPSI